MRQRNERIGCGFWSLYWKSMSFAVFVVEYDTTVQLRPTSWQLMSLEGNLCVMFEILAKNFTGNFCIEKIIASFYLLILHAKIEWRFGSWRKMHRNHVKRKMPQIGILNNKREHVEIVLKEECRKQKTETSLSYAHSKQNNATFWGWHAFGALLFSPSNKADQVPFELDNRRLWVSTSDHH